MVLSGKAGVMLGKVGGLQILIGLIDGRDLVSAQGFDEAVLMRTI